MRRPLLPRRAATLAAPVLVLVLAAAACSSDAEDARTERRSTTTTTTTAPATTLPPQEAPEPLPVAWVRQVGGAGDDTLGAVTGRDDEVVAVGGTTQGIDTPVVGDRDALAVVVASADGTVRSTGQTGGDRAESADAVAAGTDVTLACGATGGTLAGRSAGGTDGWCAAVDDRARFGTPSQSGSGEDDTFLGVAVRPDDDGAYVAGRSLGLYPGAQDPSGGFLGAGDALLIRVDADGRAVWARQFGTEADDGARGLTTSEDGDAVVTGSTDAGLEGSSNGGTDGWIARFDPYGNPRWISQFGGATTDRAAAVAAGGDPRRGTESFVAVGSSTEDARGDATGTDAAAWLFDASGDPVWAATVGSDAVDDAGGAAFDGQVVYVAGTTAGTVGDAVSTTGDAATNAGGTDGFLAALDARDGTVQWVVQFGSDADERISGLTTTEDGHLVVSGSTGGQMADTPNAGGTDGFLLAFELPASGGGAASSV